MKKYLLVIICLIFLCGCNKNENFYLEDNLYEEGKIVDINNDTLKEMEDNQKSFAIFVYMNSCSSCNKFNSILTDFLEHNNITFYSISVTDVDDTKCECVKYSPSVTLYNKGKVVAYLDANSDKDLKYYESEEEFKSWFTKYVYLKNETK